MHEERLTEYWNLAQRYRRAQTSLTKQTAIDELKTLYATTGSGTVRKAVQRFLTEIGAYGKVG